MTPGGESKSNTSFLRGPMVEMTDDEQLTTNYIRLSFSRHSESCLT